jgi:hypothetical protein
MESVLRRERIATVAVAAVVIVVVIVHDLTDEERNIPFDLTTDDIDSYLS